MSRPLIVVTQSGLMTSLSWWARMRVEGDSLVLSSVDEVGTIASLAVAQLPCEQDAKAMFKVVHERTLLGARLVDAREGSEPIRDQAPDVVADDRG